MSFSAIYYFGDSLTDAGGILDVTTEASAQYAAATGIVIPPIPSVPPYAGPFSNGAVYSQIAPGLLGIPSVNNFALGGARAVGEQLLGDLIDDVVGGTLPVDPAEVLSEDLLTFDTNLGGQVGRFLDEAALTPPPPGAAASILIGLNDFQDFSPASDATAIIEGLILGGQVLDATIDAAHDLADAGIDTIILNTLPSSSFFPISNLLPPDLADAGDLLVDGINLGIGLGAIGLELSGVDVEIVDLNALTDEIAADPGTFGFQELENSVLLGTGIEFTPNPALDFDTLGFGIEQVAFFDQLHPTANLHGVFAAFTEATLTSNTQIRGDGGDFVLGFGADDLVLAGGGDDTVFVNGGRDVVLAGLGDDDVFAGGGSDLVSGGSGDDTLFGGGGSDVLAAGAGNDAAHGGSGNDGLIDGLGSDDLYGEWGNDVFFYTQAELIGGDGTDSDNFFGGWGHDRLVLALDAETLAVEEAAFAGFRAGQTYQFASFDLTISGIEEVIFTEGFGFGFAEGAPDIAVSGALADRLEEADLFGFA